MLYVFHDHINSCSTSLFLPSHSHFLNFNIWWMLILNSETSTLRYFGPLIFTICSFHTIFLKLHLIYFIFVLLILKSFRPCLAKWVNSRILANSCETIKFWLELASHEENGFSLKPPRNLPSFPKPKSF